VFQARFAVRWQWKSEHSAIVQQLPSSDPPMLAGLALSAPAVHTWVSHVVVQQDPSEEPWIPATFGRLTPAMQVCSAHVVAYRTDGGSGATQ
jgi:hypothetical protein